MTDINELVALLEGPEVFNYTRRRRAAQSLRELRDQCAAYEGLASRAIKMLGAFGEHYEIELQRIREGK